MECVITSLGDDQLMAACLLLREDPNRQLRISSQAALPYHIEELSRETHLASLLVCGIPLTSERGSNACRQLVAQGVALTFVGTTRSYDADAIAGLGATLLTGDSETVTEFLAPRLGRFRGRAELERVARGRAGSRVGQALAAARSRYFKFNDEASVPSVLERIAQDPSLPGDDIDQLLARYQRFGDDFSLQGNSQALRRVQRLIRLCAKDNVDDPVSVTGETGSGKEHVARLIHEESGRWEAPFVAVNAAMFVSNEELASSELFGHVAGAYTGAMRDRRGALRQADGGTLFLDEVAELPPQVQAKLLRFLEDGQVRPLGSDVSERVNVRVVVATHVDLRERVRQGAFREDLYHRVSTLMIRVPPLRERPQDVIRVLRFYQYQHEGPDLDADDEERLRQAPWPGNVRQLFKVLRRMQVLELSLKDALALEGEVTTPKVTKETPIMTLKQARRAHCKEVHDRLKAENPDVTRSEIAKALDITEQTLRSYLDGTPVKRRKASPSWFELRDEAFARCQREGTDRVALNDTETIIFVGGAEGLMRNAFIWTGFMEARLEVNPEVLWEALLALPTWPSDKPIPFREEGGDPHWIAGAHPALNYRGKAIKRRKIWAQSDYRAGLRRYDYTGWQWAISLATHDVATISALEGVTRGLNAGLEASGLERHNHWIATSYDDGADNIGLHGDKVRDFAEDNVFVVLKLGAARPFLVTDTRVQEVPKGKRRPQDKVVFDEVVPAGAAVFMTAKWARDPGRDANAVLKHAVPPVAGPIASSGSIVSRRIATTVPWDRVRREVAAALARAR